VTAAPDVAVVRTGTANTASVLAGLMRAGAAPRLSDDGKDVARAPYVCLPGVGAFAAAMRTLDERGLAGALAERVREGRPTLAICLGLQLLFEGSDESPGARGLSVLAGRAERFPDTVRVPQLGWNRIEPDEGCRYLRAGHAYFANSFRLVERPAGYRVALARHAGDFVAAIEKDGVLACQFHPELSGAFGLQLLERWLRPC